jgi:UDP:flavonoid glycosyltransferase YjiC (YdhE family)
MQLTFYGLEPTWHALDELWEPERTFIVGHPLGFAARTFEEKTGAAAATIHLAPSSLRSAHLVPALPPGIDISSMPLWVKRGFWAVIDLAAIDPAITPTFNRWRARHQLPPVHRVFKSWINSPRRVIAMFPEWFGPRQPDWPERLDHASFPLWDDPAGDHIDAGLEAFLGSGSPPVVATPGSANRHAAPFFAAIAAALRQLDRRGLFLTGFPEQLPPDLPDTIIARSYAPFSEVLPRSAALVHHGGIGTLAQGFAVGIPHLVMPMAFDQPDNALRAARHGVARWLPPKKFTAERVTQTLGELLESKTVAEAAADCRERVRSVNGLSLAADVLEREAGEG